MVSGVDPAAMKRADFLIGYAIVSMLVAAQLTVQAQQVPVAAKGPNDGQSKRSRDKEKEYEVAKLFEKRRADANLSRLKRIEHRASLEQTVCTIALTDAAPKRPSTILFAYYKTANPKAVTPELSKIALFNDARHKDNPIYVRYSVAVWPVGDSQTDTPIYWVGIQLFSSAGLEFFDDHFTDDVFYHNEWKNTIASSCRNK